MSEEPYILLSLKEDKAKELSQVISNDTSRKILDYLSKVKDATETVLSKEIGIPISTVHYNLSHLKKAKLVEADEFHYSKRGKEVNHYKLANKLIIITPKETKGFAEKLKKLLPIGIIILGATFGISLFSSRPALKTYELASDAMRVAPKAAEWIEPVSRQPNIALWFLYGAVFCLILFVLIEYIYEKFLKK